MVGREGGGLNGELGAAIGAAGAAGDLLREGFGRQRSIRYKGEVVLGVVHDPMRSETFAARKDSARRGTAKR